MCTYFFRAAELPIDPYWGAVILAIYRLVLSFLALFFVKKLPRRLTYITCMGLTSLATSMIGTFFFLQSQDSIFVQENIYIRMMPLIGIIVLYFCTTFATLNIPGWFTGFFSAFCLHTGCPIWKCPIQKSYCGFIFGATHFSPS